MLRRFPLLGKKADTLTIEERDELSPSALMTNHFYTCKSFSSTCVGLVLPDTAFARKLVSDCKLDDFVYWGANTDPVQFATVFDVAEVLETSEYHTTPRKVLTLLREAHSADAVKPDTDTLTTPDAFAKLSTQRKRIVERRGYEDEERAKARKMQELEFDQQRAEILASTDTAAGESTPPAADSAYKATA
eukprot:6254572-Prymnesium_polylepis.1